MTREQVDTLLASYRVNLGRKGHLETTIMDLEQKINAAEEQVVDDLSLHAVSIDGMPHGNKVGSPTERIAIDLTEGKTIPMLEEAKQELNGLYAEHRELTLKISYVDSWMKGLTPREQWVLNHQVIDRDFWRDVIVEYSAAYNEQVTKDRLKRIRSEGMSKVYKMAGVLII